MVVVETLRQVRERELAQNEEQDPGELAEEQSRSDAEARQAADERVEQLRRDQDDVESKISNAERQLAGLTKKKDIAAAEEQLSLLKSEKLGVESDLDIALKRSTSLAETESLSAARGNILSSIDVR